MKEIIIQILGICAMISLCFVYQQKTKKKMIVFKLCADIFWMLHYLLIGGTGAAIVNFLGIFREIVFMQREEKAWANKNVWPIVFIACGWISGMFFFNHPINILLMATSSCVTLSLWIKNAKLTKFITLPICISFIVYNLFVGSYVGVMNESFLIISILISFMKEKCMINCRQCLEAQIILKKQKRALQFNNV